MRTGPRSLLAMVLTLSILASACITVNIYFPAAKVKKTAQEIVDEVYQQKKPGEKKPAPGPSSLLIILEWLGPKAAHAASNATSVSNASIRQLKKAIQKNHGKLIGHYNKGRVGISNKGYVTIRSTKGLSVKQVASLKRLVNADNQARKNLYKEVARALNLPGDQVSKIEAIFADEWRDKAAKGWWIQNNKGKWQKKE